jgi:Flp pilus assembly protein TadG
MIRKSPEIRDAGALRARATRRLPRLARLLADKSGVAAVEFALTAPIVLTLFLGGAEITNYTIAKMRVSQIALHIADNGSRIGTDSVLALKQISEAQINDLMIGAQLQAGNLDLANRGRVILSSLEPMAGNTNRFYIHWQRCYGAKVHPSTYGDQGATNLTTMGPPGKQVTSVTTGTAVMYVEVAYNYRPLVSGRLVPHAVIRDVAAMVVRDDRDFSGNGGTGVYNNEGATPSSCT